MTFEMRCKACQKVVAENEVRYDALWCSTRCSNSNRCSHIHLNMMGVCVGCGKYDPPGRQGLRKGVVCAEFRPTMALLKTGGAGPSEVCLLCSYHRGLHGWLEDKGLPRRQVQEKVVATGVTRFDWNVYHGLDYTIKVSDVTFSRMDWNAYHGLTRRHDDG